jgi:hypothetical protein
MIRFGTMALACQLSCLVACSLALLACSSHRSGFPNQAAAIADCTKSGYCSDLSLKPGVVLTAYEECWVQKLRARCDAYDRCILSCLLHGEAHDIAGGCWHVCGNIYVRIQGKLVLCPGSPVPGWQDCERFATAPSSGSR